MNEDLNLGLSSPSLTYWLFIYSVIKEGKTCEKKSVRVILLFKV